MKTSLFFAIAFCALHTHGSAAPLPDQKDTQRPLYSRDQNWLWESVKKAKQEANQHKTAVTYPTEPHVAVTYPTSPRIAVTYPTQLKLAVTYPTEPHVTVTYPTSPRLAMTYPTRPLARA